MKVALPTLKTLLLDNVLEIRYIRRFSKPGFPATRRMLCTNKSSILSSEPGKKLLNFRQPLKQQPKYNPVTKNIVIAWDILVQDYRCITADDCEVLATIKDEEEFWKYYNEKLYPMTPGDKIKFMTT